jgi:signal transduction histidine kinase
MRALDPASGGHAASTTLREVSASGKTVPPRAARTRPSTVLQRVLDNFRPAEFPTEPQRIERMLATARLFLAFGALLGVYIDPRPGAYVHLATLLLIVYIGYSAAVLLWLRLHEDASPEVGTGLQAIDVIWAVCITLFTSGPSSPFFAFFIFVLVAAAYRWSLRATVETAAVVVALLMVQSALSESLLGTRIDAQNLIQHGAYLMALGFLVGYLAHGERQLRHETSAIAQFMGSVQAQTGLNGTLKAVSGELLAHFEALQILLVIEEAHTHLAYLWTAENQESGETVLGFTELGQTERGAYLFDMPAHSWHAVRRGRPGSRTDRWELLALDEEGRRLEAVVAQIPQAFLAAHPCRSVVGVAMAFGEEWSGRLLLVDPNRGVGRRTGLRFVRALVRQVGPAAYSRYLLRRLRSRVGAIERARVARELHDGVIQSLIGLEMKVQVLRRQAGGVSAPIAGELARIQEELRQEVLNVRELMEQMKPIDLDPKHLPEYLADVVDRFRRGTGISAMFVCDFEEVNLAPGVCRELARIVQEALVNVRKHSSASNVLVRLTAEDGLWKLIVDDDGGGFAFSGRYNHRELDAIRKGPMVIKERVRSIGGELSIESVPGRGARLEISIPQKAAHERHD